MNAKEYLNQAFRVDERINSKLDQIASLRCLATKATSYISDMPGSPNRNIHKMEDTIVKIVDLQEEMMKEVDELVQLKEIIMRTINKVENVEHKVLLEKRYLCFKNWEDIALEMNYGLRYIHMLHRKALTDVEKIISK